MVSQWQFVECEYSDRYYGLVSVSELSSSTQDYLKAVWSLSEWTDTPVTAKSIAERLGLKLSSVSDAVRKLSEQGLLTHAPYGAVSLTDRGREHALAMVRRHRLIETFLVEALGYRWDQVHDDAEVLEHAVSDFMIERVAEYLGHPESDPHGAPIPAADGTVQQSDATRLTDATPGQRARVTRIAFADPDLLQFFAGQGIGYGTVLNVLPSAPYSDAMAVVAEGFDDHLTLGRPATDTVWVELID